MTNPKVPKTVKTKDKFVIVTTIQFLMEEGYIFSINEQGHLVLKDEHGEVDELFKTEKAFQEWINEVSKNY